MATQRLACEHLECLFRIAGAGRVERPDKESGVPGFEEMVRFLPKWVAVTEAADGLVEVSRNASLQWHGTVSYPDQLLSPVLLIFSCT